MISEQFFHVITVTLCVSHEIIKVFCLFAVQNRLSGFIRIVLLWFCVAYLEPQTLYLCKITHATLLTLK